MSPTTLTLNAGNCILESIKVHLVIPHYLHSCCHCQDHDGRSVTDACTVGLYLPTSDIDLVVMDSGADDVKIALKALSHKLGNTGIAIKIQVGPQTCLMTSKLELQTLCDAVLHRDRISRTACLLQNKCDAAPHLKMYACKVDMCLCIHHLAMHRVLH